MTRHLFRRASSWLFMGGTLFACSKAPDSKPVGSGGETAIAGSGGKSGSGGAATGGTNDGANGGEPAAGNPDPRHYPVPGFEDCMHAEVISDCRESWCKLPPSCFVMGSPEDEWERGLNTENQAAVNLTHSIEVQQMELTRAEWTAITGRASSGPETCGEPNCPTAMVSWWDAVSAADVLSEKRGLNPCYEPVGCTGTLGVDLECTGVKDPDTSVYDCEGYRLPTRAEVEYAARAGTWSTWYSGDITVYNDLDCHADAALEQIGWYCHNSGQKAHLVGQLDSNNFGVFDLVGNVEEWVGEQKLGSSPGGNSPRGTIGLERRRLIFGGHASLQSHYLRTANLLDAPDKARGHLNGFRLYRTLFDDSERSQAIVSEP